MRKYLIAALAAASLTPMAASAQSAGEIRRGQEEVRRDRQEVRDAMRRGDYREAREDRQELREDRRELREDWRDYRNSNRSAFRAGAYYGPRGYRYRTLTVGFQLSPSYYSQRYWVANPARYRLPAAGYNRRWVRYGNDVLLINVRNGRVITVYRDFFWR
jgi:Ni/Co efflux regulator RcnB